MSSTRVHWVRNASRAFEEALAELVGDGRPVADPAELGRQAALEAVAGSLWSDQLGPVYDSDGVMALLGGVTKQAVSDRVRRHALLALRTGSGRLVYPAFQFDGRRVLDGLAAVLAVVAPDDTEAWYVASWLTTPDPALGGRSPHDALRAGEVEAVVVAAHEIATALRG
jgi:hypothetical protein